MPRRKQDNAQRPEKKMFCIDVETDEQIQEIAEMLSMSRSDVVRQAIHNLHQYVCKDTYPDGLKLVTVADRDKLLAAQIQAEKIEE